VSRAVLMVLCGNTERRLSFVDTLTKAGWKGIQSAASVAEAAKMVHEAANACVLVDVELQDIPGLKAIPILRNLCDRIKIIFSAPENTRELESQVRALDVFYYYINSADRAELVAAVKDAVGAPKPSRHRFRPKVMIVDDDPDFHEWVRSFLQEAGYTIVSAYSEREGLDLARRQRPDVILVDIIMQTTTDGFDFCREARHDPELKHTPLLGVSAIEKVIGVPYPPDMDPSLFPVDAYLSKPVTPEKLLEELKKLIPAEGQ
jgi:CheY-like chemotaxis protein